MMVYPVRWSMGVVGYLIGCREMTEENDEQIYYNSDYNDDDTDGFHDHQ